MTDRLDYVRLTDGYVRFVPVAENGKNPYFPEGMERKKLVSYEFDDLPDGFGVSGNLGAQPCNNLVIIDFDIADKSLDDAGRRKSVEKQMRMFSDMFQIDLSDALMVGTVSGGVHCYLVWDERVRLPYNHRLDKSDSDILFGDVRSSSSVGYVCIPGNTVDGDSYTLLNRKEPLKVSKDFCELFVEYYSSEFSDMPRRSFNSLEEAIDLISFVKEKNMFIPKDFIKRIIFNIEAFYPAKDKMISEIITELRSLLDSELYLYEDQVEIPRKTVDENTLNQVRASLLSKKNEFNTWFEKRAYVFTSLACCHDDSAIFKAFTVLGVDLDSYTGNEKLSAYSLDSDLRRMSRKRRDKGFVKHGGYCCLLKKKNKKSSCAIENTAGLTLLNKSKKSNLWKKPQVVDLYKVNDKLNSGRKKAGETHKLAYNIMEMIVQPWVNHGVTNVVLNNKFLMDFFEVDENKVKRAKRILSEYNILILSRKQYMGKSSAFKVNQEYINHKHSKLLRAFKVHKGKTLLFDYRNKVITNFIENEIVGVVNPHRTRLIIDGVEKEVKRDISELPALLVEKKLVDTLSRIDLN